MFNTTEIEYLRRLYQKIFRQNANKSKEFINFVAGKPHLLRSKVEDALIDTNYELIYVHTYQRQRTLARKRDLLKELDVFIINYIENNNGENN
jgi:uncharacterized membrane protein